jgi:DnaJ-domain-containing protein 1
LVSHYLLDITAAAHKAQHERPFTIGYDIYPLELVSDVLEWVPLAIPFGIAFYLSLRLIAYLNARRPDPQPSGTSISPYETLGLEEGAGREEVENAWAQLSRKNHPDVVAHLDPVIQQMVKERFQTLGEAYQELTSEMRT